MITLGMDCGSVFFKAVLVKDGEIISSRISEGVGNRRELAQRLIDEVLEESGVSPSDVEAVVSTGRGRDLVLQADSVESEVNCLARAVQALCPGNGAIIDLGGESITVVLCKDGEAFDFNRNDKCASGSGRWLDVLSNALGISLEQIDEVVGQATRKLPLTGQCGVFMESEVINSVNLGENVPDIVAGICESVSKFAGSQVKRIGANGKMVVTGGVSRLACVTNWLGEKLQSEIVSLPINPQLAAAYGAALIGVKEA